MRKTSILFFILFLLTAFAVQAGSISSKTLNDKPFISWYKGMAEKVKANPDYHKIPLDTDSQAHEFVEWLHALYRQKITPAQFERDVEAKYPGHQAEARFIVKTLPPPEQRPAQ